MEIVSLVKDRGKIIGFIMTFKEARYYKTMDETIEIIEKYGIDNATVGVRGGNKFVKGKNCNLTDTTVSVDIKTINQSKLHFKLPEVPKERDIKLEVLAKIEEKSKVKLLDTKESDSSSSDSSRDSTSEVVVNKVEQEVSKQEEIKEPSVKPTSSYTNKVEVFEYNGNSESRYLDATYRYDVALVEDILNTISENGIKIDTHLNTYLIETMSNVWGKEYGKLEEYTFDGIGLQSTKDIGHVFTEVYDCKKYCKTTKKGNLSFDKEVLQKIEDADEGDASIAAGLVKKLRSDRSLINKLLEFDRYRNNEGYVFPKWNYGETYRISFAEPGISNISKKLRQVVVAPDGYNLCSIDYSQQEPYILISWLKIEELKKLVLEYNDFYTALAVYLLDKEITTEERAKFKTAWLATSYGAQIPTIAKQIGKKYAQVYFDGYNSKLPQVAKLKEEIVARIAKGDYTCESYFGRRRNLQYMGSHTNRTMLNNPIQMTGSDILFFAIEDIEKYKANNWIKNDEIRIYWTIHDEIILVYKEGIGMEEHCKNIAKKICYRISNWIPLKVKVTFSKNYAGEDE